MNLALSSLCVWGALVLYLSLFLISLLVLPGPQLRPGKKCLGYWPILGLAIIGLVIATVFPSNSYTLLIGFQLFAFGCYILLKHYGNERADNAAWLWLLASQAAFILMLLLQFGTMGETSTVLLILLLLIILISIWPFNFWWNEVLSQSPLAAGLLIFAVAASLPFGAFSGTLLPWADEGLFHLFHRTLLVFLGIGLFLAALSLGRQSDLKMSFALLLWFWLLTGLYLNPYGPFYWTPYETGSSLINWGPTTPELAAGLEAATPFPPEGTPIPDWAESVSYLHQPILGTGVMIFSLVLAFTLLLGHLQRVAGSTYIEDFHPLAANPRLYRFRRCWTLTSWLLAGLPLTILWTQLATWISNGATSSHLSLWWIALLLLAMVFLAGSLFHLRARLFYGDAQTNGKLVVRDLGMGTYLLIVALLALAVILPFLE